MKTESDAARRIREVTRVFIEHDIGDLEFLEGWSGEQLEELAAVLDEEEYQTLLDELESAEEERR